jgi:hypothetical protein
VNPAKFWFDGAEPVIGWTDGDTWNGWGCPKFHRDQIDAACAALRTVGLRVERDGDEITIVDPETDLRSQTKIRCNQQGMWDFGDLGLTWNHEPYEPNPYCAGDGLAEPWGE